MNVLDKVIQLKLIIADIARTQMKRNNNKIPFERSISQRKVNVWGFEIFQWITSSFIHANLLAMQEKLAEAAAQVHLTRIPLPEEIPAGMFHGCSFGNVFANLALVEENEKCSWWKLQR